MDNIFIERLWRSVKHEDIYLKEYPSVEELQIGMASWFERYNTWRPHQHLSNRTPDNVYSSEWNQPHQIAA
jgi:putative transposase